MAVFGLTKYWPNALDEGKMDIQAVAAQMGVDTASLSSLVSFLQSNLEKNPELRELAAKHPEQFMEQGVRAWHEASTKFLSELAHGQSERAKQLRAELAEQVWTQLRAEKGLPS